MAVTEEVAVGNNQDRILREILLIRLALTEMYKNNRSSEDVEYIKEAVTALNTKINSIDTQIKDLDTKIERKCDALESKINTLDDKIERKLDTLDSKLDKKIDKLTAIETDVKKINDKQQLIEQSMNEAVQTNRWRYGISISLVAAGAAIAKLFL